MASSDAILVINCGSSSIKFAIFDTCEHLFRITSGAVERIGLANGQLSVSDEHGAKVVDKTQPIADHYTALQVLLTAVEKAQPAVSLVAIGHRFVHGGPDCDCPVLVTQELVDRLHKLIPLAPLHLPHNIAGVVAVSKSRPHIPQIACFDTAFHHDLPRLARITALPRRFEQDGIRRYGFHGLSYEYVVNELRHRDEQNASERLIVAHLGNGASMAAIRDDRSIETTMGFSTVAGLPMGSRSGDLDPGILLFLLGEKRFATEDLQHLLYQQSGLLGLSGISSNMQDLLKRADEPNVAEAIDFFCYRSRQYVAALTASLGGLDRLVFTGGIGVNAPSIRGKICAGLEYLGIVLDAERNIGNTRTISADRSRVTVQAFATDEELVIARHVRDMLTAHPFAQESRQ